MNNPYTRYLEQQQGRGIPVFRGSPWQMGHGQMGYGFGGLFRSMARAVMPMVKSGANTLGNIALNSGKNLRGDVLAGKNVKEAAKARALEAANVAKNKAVQHVRTFAQTGSGRRAKQPRTGSKGTKRKRETAKKRKRSPSTVRTTLSKKQKTSPQDIFG
jgi:hypothetical protein